jgi:hypothetical protein
LATLQIIEPEEQTPKRPQEIALPAPTAWPLVLAFGFTLVFTGLLTSASVSVLGAVLTIAGCAGWFRDVLPHEREEVVPVVGGEKPAMTTRAVVERLPIAADQLRAWLPLRTHPISAGVKGGLAGSVAMAVLACAYGVLKAGSIWYPINLLGASIYAQWVKLGPSQLYGFHWDTFVIAFFLHLVISTAVGLLYGAMLPMFSRHPILLGGLIGPVLWSGLLYTMLGLLNPVLESHIDWFWFMASQVAFGLVAGLVVVREPRKLTRENVPFTLRAGVKAPGTFPHDHEEDGEEQR